VTTCTPRPDNAFRYGERFRKNHVERFAARHALAEFVRLRAQLNVRVFLDGRLEGIDRRNGLLVLLDQPLIAAAKNLLKETGRHRISVCVAASTGACKLLRPGSENLGDLSPFG
jgi:hypothetical protein